MLLMGNYLPNLEIRRPLARGGAGETFLAAVKTEGEEDLFVLKRVPRSGLVEEGLLRREFALLSRLRHPNIAHVVDFGSDTEFHYLLEEFVDGPDLFEAVREANDNQILSALVQILRGLDYLHRQGIVHGDLKTENILVVRNASLFDPCAVKLIDFGLARPLAQIQPGRPPSGTLHFIAPEVLLQKGYDGRADLYALGVSLYRILTGRFPFEGEAAGGQRVDRLLQAQIEKRPVEPRHFRTDLSRGLNDVTMRLLANRPEDRFSSAAEVLKAVNKAEGESFSLRTEEELLLTLREGAFVGRAAVPPWPEEEMAEFLRGCFYGDPIPESWRSKILQMAGGDPRRLILIVEYALRSGVLRLEGGHFRWDSSVPPPKDLEEVRRKMGGRLEEERKGIIRLTAFAGEPLSREVLQRITGLPEAILDSHLGLLEKEGWIVRVLHNGLYHFKDSGKTASFFPEAAREIPLGQSLGLVEEMHRRGDFIGALRQLEAVSTLIEKEEAPLPREERFRFHAIASLVLIEAGRLDEAAGHCQKLLKIPELTAEEQGRGYNRLGWIAIRQGDIRRAREMLDRAAPCWERSGNAEGLASLHNFRGMCHQAQREEEAALVCFQKAVDQLPQGHPWRPLFRLNLAAQLQAARRFGEALNAYEEARRDPGTDPAFRARLLHQLANLYLFLGRLEQAGRLAHESLKLSIENGLRSLEGSNYLLLSVLEDREGRLDACRGFVEKAEALFERHGSASEKGTAVLHRAYYLFTVGEEGRSGETAARIGTDHPSETALGAQAALLIGKIAARKRPPDLAAGLAALEKAEAFFEREGDLANLWEVWAARGELHRENDAGRSAASFEKAVSLLNRLAETIPEDYREGFFRDRKRERIEARIRKESGDTMANTAQERYGEIVRINRLLASEHHLDTLLEAILDQSLELLKGDRGFVLLLEEGEFRVRSSRNIDRKAVEEGDEATEGHYSATIARDAAVGGRSILVVNAQTDERFRQARSVVELKLQAVLAVPMKAGSEVIGVIYVDNRFSQGAFDDAHQRLLEAFADQAALAVRNARQMEEIRARQKELVRSRKQIEELNRILEERLHLTEEELERLGLRYQKQQEELQLRYSYRQIIGESPKMKKVLRTIDRVIDSEATVVIFGESGTGKELIARAIHYNGPRKQAPFVAENCAAIPEALMESELFGHKRGSFTGADADRQGILEIADGGTVFLDEIGDMPLGMQSKLLRFLQERQFRPIGASDYKKVNVRILAATHRNLEKLIREKKFREDLYYRLNVVSVTLPPLRERPEDIPLLVRHFLSKWGEKGGLRGGLKINRKALEMMMRHRWSGNIRELENEIQRCAAMGADLITPELLSETLREGPPAPKREIPLSDQVERLEKAVILATLKRCGHSRVQAAKHLGFSRITLYKKMKTYGIPFRKSAT